MTDGFLQLTTGDVTLCYGFVSPGSGPLMISSRGRHANAVACLSLDSVVDWYTIPCTGSERVAGLVASTNDREAGGSLVTEAVPPEIEMASLTVRISPATHAASRGLAAETDESMTEILDKAIEFYRRQHFLAGLDADFAALREDESGWKEEVAERVLWDATLVDGLEH